MDLAESGFMNKTKGAKLVKLITICTCSKFISLVVRSTFSIIFVLLNYSQYILEYQNFNLNKPRKWNQK